jgi:hypothetical protein
MNEIWVCTHYIYQINVTNSWGLPETNIIGLYSARRKRVHRHAGKSMFVTQNYSTLRKRYLEEREVISRCLGPALLI